MKMTSAHKLAYRFQKTIISESILLLMNYGEKAIGMNPTFLTRDCVEEIRRELIRLWERDLKNVEDGFYPAQLLKDDWEIPSLSKLHELIIDFPKFIRRRKRKNYQDFPKKVDLEHYPNYYRRNFHCQTDGWLSQKSARLWDLQVDLFFLGSAKAINRSVLPHLKLKFANEKRPKLMDVACGTGRFLTQVSRVLPQANLTAFDMSSFYLMQARQNLAHAQDINFVQGNAEQMPFCDQYFDGMTAIGFLHELPSDARLQALKEIHRVLKKGGLFVLSDAIQFEDQSQADLMLRRLYESFNEPFLKSYMQWDLREALTQMGFSIKECERSFLLKNIVAIKE